MKAGPKTAVTATPLDLRRLPKSGGDRVVAFVERFAHVPKGVGARKRLKLRPWQQAIVRGLFDTPRPRQALLSLPRGNGKTTLCAALGLYGLFADGVEGAEVLIVASDERQARIAFNLTRRMVELDARLADRCQVFQDRLYVPETDSVLRPLPAESAALQGYNPSLLIVDELHVVTEATWEAATLAAGKRDSSLTLAISTPAADADSVMWKLVEHGRADVDESFFFREFAAPDGCNLDDETHWHTANPALGDFLALDALRATRRTVRESSFRRFRLGQWTVDDAAWLPSGAWAACANPAVPVPDGADVVIGFDGSYRGDATAIVVCEIGAVPHLDVVAVWEPPEGANPDWSVPIVEVEDTIRAACVRWRAREVIADPFRWSRSLQLLAEEGLPVVDYPQTPARMTPGTVKFFEAIVNRTLTHSGDPDLARHVANTRVRNDSRGTRLTKESKSSRRRIDLAVAALMAYDRATQATPVSVASGIVDPNDYGDDDEW